MRDGSGTGIVRTMLSKPCTWMIFLAQAKVFLPNHSPHLYFRDCMHLARATDEGGQSSSVELFG